MTRRARLFLVALGTASALAGCDSIRAAAGLTKVPPDEFAVSTKAPLVVPPDYNLRPPQPGAAPITQTDPNLEAQAAMFGANDPQSVAAAMTGNYTPGEKMLLANANAQQADPAIRAELMGDDKTLQGADRSFTDRLLASSATPDTGRPVNADAEIAKGTKTAVKPRKKASGGWFDWF